jgi:type II secretory ATPase GspE/PulE/Tfp pilus assembly ATPase PilB-like protein
MVAGSPIINLVNVALLTAIRDKASDIHIEPDKKGPGPLPDRRRPAGPDEAAAGMHAAIVSRVKVIGKMDVAEKRLPQEGRVHIIAEGREIDLRVSSMPTLLGEKLVLRILDKANLKVRLDELGFRPTRSSRSSGCWTSRTGSCWSPARPAAARRPRSTRAGPGPQPGAEHRDDRGPGRVPARPDQPDARPRARSG